MNDIGKDIITISELKIQVPLIQKFEQTHLKKVKPQLKLDQALPPEQIDKLIRRTFQNKYKKLAIRALVDKARKQVLKAATDRLDANQKQSAIEYAQKNRQAGQSEQSWNLRINALDHVNPLWKDEFDKDMFATINAKEFNKVFYAPAYEFSEEDYDNAVISFNDGFYDNEILKYYFEKTSPNIPHELLYP
jgi:hypothetical protein